jgi:hypothetical protein
MSNAISPDYANHERDPNDNPDHVGSKQFTPSILTVKWVLHPHDWKALDIQKSKKFWKEPKALLVTLAICCVAPMIQGKRFTFNISSMLTMLRMESSCKRKPRMAH